MNGIPEETIAQLKEMAEQHEVGCLMLYGSRGRGDNRPDSDIDLAVEGCEGFVAFRDDVLENLQTPFEVDIANLEECDSPDWVDHVHEEAVVLYGEL